MLPLLRNGGRGEIFKRGRRRKPHAGRRPVHDSVSGGKAQARGLRGGEKCCWPNGPITGMIAARSFKTGASRKMEERKGGRAQKAEEAESIPKEKKKPEVSLISRFRVKEKKIKSRT